MPELLLRLAAFQAGWFACVLGAAGGVPILGPVLVGALALVHLAARRRAWEGEALLLALAALGGYAADSGLVLAGLLNFPEPAALGGPSPLWMVALWVNLALTLNGPLAWLRGRYALAGLLGAVAGPLAYQAGARLGGASLGEPAWASWTAIGLVWLVAMPLLVRLAEAAARLRPAGAGTGPREGARP